MTQYADQRAGFVTPSEPAEGYLSTERAETPPSAAVPARTGLRADDPAALPADEPVARPADDSVAARSSRSVADKVYLVSGLVGAAMLLIAVVGLTGLVQAERETAELFDLEARRTQQVELRSATAAAGRAATQLASTDDAVNRAELQVRLEEMLLPTVAGATTALATTARADAQGGGAVASAAEAQLTRLAAIDSDLAAYDELLEGPGPSAAATATIFDAVDQQVSGVLDDGATTTTALRGAAADGLVTWRRVLYLSTIGGLLLGLVLVRRLVRDIGPRVTAYSHFAADLAAGRATQPLEPRGTDEVAELGRALHELRAAEQRRAEHEASQAEFVATLQATTSEDEAHDLVQRHIERSVAGTTAVVLTRNINANRLEAATPLAYDNYLASRLVSAEPRSCVAVRLGRVHEEASGSGRLLTCGVCSEPGLTSLCEPLRVGGEVIGSVLVGHTEAIDADGPARVRTTVIQAAPVLANLRNVSLAEFRANNDALTGLPNKRATVDALKRMVAQANRSVTPLAAIMLDLDHLKQINDQFGHAKGDEVLAAVGVALQASLRASDFAGRFGGEEFLILLPETTTDGAFLAAEKIRMAVGATIVPGMRRAITASLGIADLLRHAGSADRLLREADRALYAAKVAGRNRTLVASTDQVRPEPLGDIEPPSL